MCDVLRLHNSENKYLLLFSFVIFALCESLLVLLVYCTILLTLENSNWSQQFSGSSVLILDSLCLENGTTPFKRSLLRFPMSFMALEYSLRIFLSILKEWNPGWEWNILSSSRGHFVWIYPGDRPNLRTLPSTTVGVFLHRHPTPCFWLPTLPSLQHCRYG